MIKKLFNYLVSVRDLQRVQIALSKGIAMMNLREVNLMYPGTWEFSGFSQNGEDGVLQVLRENLLNRNAYFIEIGAASGFENNTSWLLVAENYNGLLIEGSTKLYERAKRNVASYGIATECLNIFVTRINVEALKSSSLFLDPDVFSIDIDGNDYYIAKTILDSGFRPKIFVVEYNSVFGPDRSLTIEYQENFVFGDAHHTQLYYGVSISGWRTFFAQYGYHFVTVDKNGVNGFFVDPDQFDPVFLKNIRSLNFTENLYQLMKFKMPHDKQFQLISDQKFTEI